MSLQKSNILFLSVLLILCVASVSQVSKNDIDPYQCQSHVVLELKLVLTEVQAVRVRMSSTSSTEGHLNTETVLANGNHTFRISASLQDTYTVHIGIGKSETAGKTFQRKGNSLNLFRNS